ncbi:MAG: Urease alpha subunit, partial [uncultured Ramlibacter sp.]
GAHRTPRLCRDVRPHHRRPRATGRHRAGDRGRGRLHLARRRLRRGGEVRRRQDHPRRHGAEPAHSSGGLDGLRADERAGAGPLGHRQGRHRTQGRPHRRDRQGRQPRHAARRRRRDRPRHRDHQLRRQHRHSGRHRQPHPLHLPAADRGGAGRRHHHHAGRRHRSGHRHLRHHLHAGALEHGADAAGCRRLPDEPGLPGQGQRQPAACAARAGRGRRHRAQAARGLGHDAIGHRHLPRCCRRHRHPGGDPQRHAQRVRLRGEHHRGDQGSRPVRLPHRRRRGRPRAGHPARGGRGQLPAVVDQPDDALHGQHAGRARRHADGVPPPGPGHRRGPGLRREPHPQGDHRRRGHPARPGRHQHDVQRLAGHGPGGRGDPAHLA